MNSLILSELVFIRWLLIGLLTLGVIFFFYALAIIIGNRRMMAASQDLRIRDYLITEAQMFESKGDNQKFMEKAEELIGLYPEDVMANWYYAISNYKNNHLGTALSALGRIKQIDPAWSKETVDDYIETIQSEMNGPKSA